MVLLIFAGERRSREPRGSSIVHQGIVFPIEPAIEVESVALGIVPELVPHCLILPEVPSDPPDERLPLGTSHHLRDLPRLHQLLLHSLPPQPVVVAAVTVQEGTVGIAVISTVPPLETEARRGRSSLLGVEVVAGVFSFAFLLHYRGIRWSVLVRIHCSEGEDR